MQSSQLLSIEQSTKNPPIPPDIQLPKKEQKIYDAHLKRERFNAFREYCCALRWICKYRKSLNSIVSKHTGRSLKKSTRQQYQASYHRETKRAAEAKKAIQLLVWRRIIGTDKTRARWLKAIQKIQPSVDYLKTLKPDEKRFVEAYEGDAIKASRTVGHSGGWAAIRPIAQGYLNNSAVRDALKKKKMVSSPFSQIIEGGGHSDEGRRLQAGGAVCGCIHVVPNLKAICNRFSKIENRLWATYKEIGKGRGGVTEKLSVMKKLEKINKVERIARRLASGANFTFYEMKLHGSHEIKLGDHHIKPTYENYLDALKKVRTLEMKLGYPEGFFETDVPDAVQEVKNG